MVRVCTRRDYNMSCRLCEPAMDAAVNASGAHGQLCETETQRGSVMNTPRGKSMALDLPYEQGRRAVGEPSSSHGAPYEGQEAPMRLNLPCSSALRSHAVRGPCVGQEAARDTGTRRCLPRALGFWVRASLPPE